MNKELENNLSKITNYLLLNNSLNNRSNSDLYKIVNEHFNDLNKFYIKNFNLELRKDFSSSEISLRKISKNNPLGFKGLGSAMIFRYIFLTLSALSVYEVGDSPYWTHIEEKVKSQYKKYFNHDLTISENYKSSKLVRKFLVEKEYISLKEQEGDDDDPNSLYLYNVLKTPTSKGIRKKTEKDSVDLPTLVKTELLLNGCINKINNSALFSAMKENKDKCLDKADSFFNSIEDVDGCVYSIFDWGDAYVLIYKGANVFPRIGLKQDRLFVEIASLLKPYEKYTFDELITLSKQTVVYKETATLKDNLARNLKYVIDKMFYYGILANEKNIDGLYLVTECANYINKNYNEETQFELELNLEED